MALLKLLTLTSLTMLSLNPQAHAGGGAPVKDETGRFTIATNVTAEQSKLMLADLKYLHSMPLRANDPELSRVMEIGEANNASMSQWLADRVQYIIGQDTNLEEALVAVQAGYGFENPGILPDVENAPTPRDATPSPRKGVVVMSNIGAAAYYIGKKQGVLVGFKIPGGSQVNLTSPRSGVIMIGEGHFMPLLKKYGHTDTNIATEAYTLFRLGTFFHEARHSDGNGKSLGFLHALCPAGHDFANINACDRNLNGPYTVGALVVRNFAANCVGCSVSEREALKLEALDSFNRVIKETVRSAGPDYRELCDSLRELNKQLTNPIELPEFCKQAAAPGGNVVKSTFWDARPEGYRQ